MTGYTAYQGLLNSGCRVPICGFVSHYNTAPDQQPPTPCQRLRAEGLDSCVDAFIGMLRGENFGKTKVQIG